MDIVILLFLFLIFFLLVIILYLSFKLYGNIIISSKEFDKLVSEHRLDAIKRSRAVLTGQFSEQMSPYLPNFKYSPTEIRFIGKPIDFIVFKGMDSREKIDEVIFIEVKSGNSKLSTIEKSLKDAIDNKRVKWEEYRVPK